jgi:hypothetical protein
LRPEPPGVCATAVDAIRTERRKFRSMDLSS